MPATRPGQTPDKGAIIQAGRDPAGRRRHSEIFQSPESRDADTLAIISASLPIPPPPPLPFPTDGLFYKWDPTLQDDSFLVETISPSDRDADFIGDPEWQSSPPLVILDGVEDRLKTPTITSGEGYGGGGQEFTAYGVFLGESARPTSYIFVRELGRQWIQFLEVDSKVSFNISGEGVESIVGVSSDTLHSIGMGVDDSSFKGWLDGAEELNIAREGATSHFAGPVDFGSSAGSNLLQGQIGFWFWWDRLLTNPEISEVHAVLQQSYPELL
jgi:hypothetical protein